ncbi:30S ribosomal protein S27ae [Candidatus Woesearchaeota archaeon]|nr:30S ribosomal protein S27ae [Candidatus Woesearchaeota archaeon]
MAKKKVKPKKPSERWKKYKVSGNKVERQKTCPKCGPGMFLGAHKDRVTCGNCHYTEFLKK